MNTKQNLNKKMGKIDKFSTAFLTSKPKSLLNQKQQNITILQNMACSLYFVGRSKI